MNSDANDDLNSPIGRRRLPSMQALLCFEVAAREQSFSRAADILCLTHSAVSRSVRLLEETLGIALFERRKRGVHLTEPGMRLAQATQAGFDQIESACQELLQHRSDSPLTVACEPTLLMKWLIPNLPAFQRAHPEIALRLIAAEGDALTPGAELAIRRNDIHWPEDTDATLLFAGQVGPVCHPSLIDTFFTRGEDRLTLNQNARLLHTRTRPQAWADWAKRTGQRLPIVEPQNYEHFYYSIQAAIAGMGVAIAPRQLVEQDLVSGVLAAPLNFIEDGSGYYLLAARHLHAATDKRALQHWLQMVGTSEVKNRRGVGS